MKINHNAYTLIEVLMASALTVILLLMGFNFYNTVRVVYSSGTAAQLLQDATNIVLSRIIEGATEYQTVGGVQVAVDTFRLAQAMEYCIGTGASCINTSTAELHYWGTDGLERWYKLNDTATALIYHHPTVNYTTMVDETIYTAPPGATITLRFWVPAVANYTAAVVGVDVAMTQNVLGKTVSGASTTIVNLRNHP